MTSPTPYSHRPPNVYPLFPNEEGLNLGPVTKALAGVAISHAEAADTPVSDSFEAGHGFVVDGQEHPTAKAAAAAALRVVYDVHDSMAAQADVSQDSHEPRIAA